MATFKNKGFAEEKVVHEILRFKRVALTKQRESSRQRSQSVG
jgi:hypothetical protein